MKVFNFSILLILFSCASNNKNVSEENKLIGKWQFTNSYSPDLKKVIEYVTVSVKKPANYKGVLLGPINSFPPDQDSVKAYDNFSEKDKIYNFKSDHTFEIVYLNSYELNEEGEFIKKSISDPEIFQGKWRLISNGKVELDYNVDDYLKCCVYDYDGNQWNNLKANRQLLEKRKKLPFVYNKISNDSLYIYEEIDENNVNNYKFLKNIYLKIK